MGLLDDAASIISARTSTSKRASGSKSHRKSSGHHHSHSRKDRSKSRSRSQSRHRSSRSTVGGGISGVAASIFGGGDDDDNGLDYGRSDHPREHRRRSKDKDDDGTRSFFSLPDPSRSSFFSGFGGRPSGSGPSYYRRSPRPGFVSRMFKKLKRLLRDLVYYAKRHPMKVFMLVLMPLLTGGALTALLARFGLRLPPFLERMLGLAARAGAGDSLGVVGEAVRMVSGGGGGGARVTRTTTSMVQRGREGSGMAWEARRTMSERGDYGLGGGGGGWGDGLKKGIANFFS
ncbi:uncharacterized protein B0T15DRAFT_46744 [Chaetomium strumarium]|uniref:Uncharacterized protein n=1 Tax=Chaetomium strumarium TaxID=1170767 RepID=A0AAJ0H2M7_9PEZI|nr:hypothetical protein B0T15DRAFT_46744 [Chaetomium strumarium]